MQHKVSEREVAQFTGRGQAPCAEGLADSFFSEIWTVNVEMDPPRSVVVIQVMIKVPRISAEGQGVGRHDVQRYSHTTPRESLVGRGVRPAHIVWGSVPQTLHRGFSKPGWQTLLKAGGSLLMSRAFQ
jgi:hypothetical protein